MSDVMVNLSLSRVDDDRVLLLLCPGCGKVLVSIPRETLETGPVKGSACCSKGSCGRSLAFDLDAENWRELREIETLRTATTDPDARARELLDYGFDHDALGDGVRLVLVGALRERDEALDLARRMCEANRRLQAFWDGDRSMLARVELERDTASAERDAARRNLAAVLDMHGVTPEMRRVLDDGIADIYAERNHLERHMMLFIASIGRLSYTLHSHRGSAASLAQQIGSAIDVDPPSDDDVDAEVWSGRDRAGVHAACCGMLESTSTKGTTA